MTPESRLVERIAEIPEHSLTDGWRRRVLPPILDKHRDYDGYCGVCKAGDPGILGEFSSLQKYPCETVQEIMDAVDFEPWELAHTAIDTLVNHARAAGASPLTVLRRAQYDDRDSTTGTPRFAFEVVFPKRGVFVVIPGLAVAELQQGPGGIASSAERIYIDGGSWVWQFAVNRILEAA